LVGNSLASLSRTGSRQDRSPSRVRRRYRGRFTIIAGFCPSLGDFPIIGAFAHYWGKSPKSPFIPATRIDRAMPDGLVLILNLFRILNGLREKLKYIPDLAW